MPIDWLITIFGGLASKIRGMDSKIPFIFNKLNLLRLSKPDMPNSFNIAIHIYLFLSLYTPSIIFTLQMGSSNCCGPHNGYTRENRCDGVTSVLSQWHQC